MFHHSESRKKGGFLPLTILRLILSLAILAIFGLGIYQAFRYFSGVDPLKLDPQSIAIGLLASEEANQAIRSIFNGNPPEQILKLQQELGKDEEDASQQGTSLLIEDGSLSNRSLLFKFAIVADSHKSNDNLARALELVKGEGVKFVIGLGDFSEVGTTSELQSAKEAFKRSGVPFYTTAGDHDLWSARDNGLAADTYFNDIFGSAYSSFSDLGIRFIILYNSDNYDGVSSAQMDWLEDELINTADQTTYLFTHEPLFHPSSDRVMGKSEEKVGEQAEKIRQMISEYGVEGVFAADIHSFTSYQDPVSGIDMVTVGALSSERNTQTPRFAIVDIFDNGSYNIREVEVK